MPTPRSTRQKRKAESSRASVLRAAFGHLRSVEFEGEAYPDYVGMADGYAKAVVAGKVPENEYVVMACERYLRMRSKADSSMGEYYWSDAHVIEVCAFIEACPQGAGADDEDDGLTLEPWQCWIIAAIFGFRHNVGNKSVRWVIDVFIDIGRKNGKSALTARIDLYCFLYEDEAVSELYLAASSREQAKKVYNPIRQVLLAAPELVADHCLKVTAKETRRPDGGFITTISAIGNKEDGHNPHIGHIDELHAVKQALYDVIDSAMGARANQLFLKTTTAGVFAHGPAYSERKRAERVLRGQEKADRYFAVIYTVPVELLKEPLTWHNVVLANPLVDTSQTLARKLRDEMEAARFDPKKKANFLTKRLNVYSQSASHALTADQWDACFEKNLRLEDFRGRKCWLGGDLSSHDDQTAIGLIFELGADIAVFAWHFLPMDSPPMEDEEMAATLRDWSDDGWLTLTPGSIVDHDAVQQKVEDLSKMFSIEYAVFDMAHSVQMVSSLQKKNINAGNIRSTPAEVSEPTKDLITRARHQRLKHNGNPVLSWNAKNTCLRQGDLWKPTKDITMPSLKIDGISALVHANTARLGRVSTKPPKRPFDPNRVMRTV